MHTWKIPTCSHTHIEHTHMCQLEYTHTHTQNILTCTPRIVSTELSLSFGPQQVPTCVVEHRHLHTYNTLTYSHAHIELNPVESCRSFSPQQADRNPPPPPRGFPIYYVHQEPCVRGPPKKHLVQILQGGSSYSRSRFLMREHSK